MLRKRIVALREITGKDGDNPLINELFLNQDYNLYDLEYSWDHEDREDWEVELKRVQTFDGVLTTI
jgi:hypothetical protein